MRPIPTSAELLERFRTAADAKWRERMGPEAPPLSWAPTSFFNILRVACVRLAERVLYLVDDRFRAGFLETATGADLDAWAASEAPGFPRQPVTAATARLTLTRADTSLAGTIPAGSRFGTTPTASTPQVTFRSTADVPVAAGVASVAVDVECEATGEAGNVLAGTINRSLSTLFATFGTVTNTIAGGGGPAETDEQFRARLRQRDARFRRGTIQALTVGALGVPGVRRVTIYDYMNTAGAVPAGEVLVIVGDAAGVGSDPMAEAVARELVNWSASGVRVSVDKAEPRSVLLAPELVGATQLRVEITHAKDPTFDRVAVERTARLALAALFAGLQYNQPLYVDQLKTAVMDVDRRIRRVRFVPYPAGTPALDIIAAPSSANQRWAADDATWLFQGWTEGV